MKRLWSVLGFYALWRAWLIFLAFMGTKLVPLIPTFTPQHSFGLYLPWWQWVWANFDGVVFLNIAEDGYTVSEVPFFPLFPLMVRSLRDITGILYLQSGLIVSTLAFLVALIFCYKLLQYEKRISLWPLFLLSLLLFPTAYHFTAVYNDALFFALATASLYYVRRNQLWIAGLVGGFATLARLNGLALFFVIAAQYFFHNLSLQQAWDHKQWWAALKRSLNGTSMVKSGVLSAVLVPLFFLGYLFFIHNKFGDWQLFFRGVEVWHRDKLTFPLQTFWRYFKILLFSDKSTFVYLVAALEAFFTALYIAVLGFSWKKIHPVYWLMMFFHWLIPVVTGTLQGMPRYGLHLFPLFFCLALFLEKRPLWQRCVYFSISAALQIFYVMYFTSGYFVT